MLVLSRREQQSIWIGDEIQIMICRVAGRRVTIGIEAPPDQSIRRGELVDRQRQTQQSTDLSDQAADHQEDGTTKDVLGKRAKSAGDRVLPYDQEV